MRSIIYLMLFTLIISCEKNSKEIKSCEILNNCIDNDTSFHPIKIQNYNEYKFTFQKNSQIHIYSDGGKINNAAIEDGNSLVFEYSYIYNDKPGIADDEYSENIKFEVEPDSSCFLISDDILNSSTAVFGKSCFCADYGYHWITGGCIKGSKISENEWQIDMNITAEEQYGSYSRMLSEKFTLTNK
jgi:hypothetical protein